jgi:DMSO/TMAO reductase YedYZ heme-binding membrane subunit
MGLTAVTAARLLGLPRLFEWAFVIAVAATAWGALTGGFHHDGYGEAVHVLLSATAAPILVIALIRVRVFPDLSQRSGFHERGALALLAFSLGFCVGIVYELYLFTASKALGVAAAIGYPTLVRHLALDALGAVTGAVAVATWLTLESSAIRQKA